MTTRDMLRNVLITLYLGAKTAYKRQMEYADSRFFSGYLQGVTDRLTIAYSHPDNALPATYLYNDYILWRYNEKLWEKYSEVLNCEEA